ncbi:uncharacterized protein LOC141684147 [Apium graveolens]|uniref:uncharacterized protein LOC141684147 n=1 Tax=Apium graveolens TaxID=4045 RepID=UPI003D78E8C3
MANGARFTLADMQNPLFIHPSDGPLSVSVSKLQGASDYRSWKRSFEIQLSAKRKLAFLNGTVIRDPADAIQAAQWDTCNDLVISWLHSNVSEVWSQLEKRFLLSNGSRKYKLNKDLFALKQNNMKLNDYFTTLSSLWEEIESMNALPVVTTVATDITAFIDAINKQKAEARLFQFLNGLDDMYVALRSQLLMQNPLPTVEIAFSALQQEESQKDLFTMASLDATAMYSRSQPEYKGPPCHACGQKNHSGDRCWTVIGYPRWHRKYKPQISRTQHITHRFKKQANNASQVNSSTNVTLTTQQLQQLLQMLPQNAATNPVNSSLTDDEIEHCFSGMVSCHLSTVDNNTWIIDSGASDHMASSLATMHNVQKAPPELIIKLPTGASTVISHIGKITMKNGLVLERVLYVPQFQHNLLSIHRLSQDNNCIVNFHPMGCVIADAVTKTKRAVGVLQNGLYYLKDEPIPATVHSATKQSKSDFALWHTRLGHAPISKLRYIPSLKNKTLPIDKVCVTCPMSKFAKLPFELSDSHASAKFELVHVDTWGPYKVATRGKYKYFLTLVDDYSRVTWVYLIQQKSDYLETLKTFNNYVVMHFNTTIRTIRSDNAAEFKDALCTQYYAEKGILHQKSCVHRPQQNARVERRHRSVLEISRCLRFQAFLPLEHWGECVLTAVYLFNRLPTPVLGNKTPYEVLFEKLPEYDHIKAYGCLAFAANPSQHGDKFGPRGVPCVFVGYPFNQKGYNLLDLTTKRTFVSRDVTFHESIFPLNGDNTAAYIQPTPVAMPQPSVYHHDDLVIDEVQDESETENDGNNAEAPPEIPVSRRSARVVTKPTWLGDYVNSAQSSANIVRVVNLPMTTQFFCFSAKMTANIDPVSFKQALQHAHWVEAMNKELTALEKNNT